MEAIGGIASVTGVVGFIGQIAGGCKVVKEIIGDIKNASKDITRLAECIKSIEESSNEVLRQHEQLKTHYGMQDIPAAGAHMLEAIKSVESKLSSSAAIFGNSTKGSKNKWKQFWHRLKYAANKEEIAKSMLWVDSTTQQVTLVQQNLSRIVQLEQSGLLKDISANIIAVPHAIHDSTDAIISAQHKQTETLCSEMRNQSYLLQNMSTTITTKASQDIRECLFLTVREALEECIEKERVNIRPQMQNVVGKCLQRDLPIHLAKLEKQSKEDVAASNSSSFERTETSSLASRALRAKKRSRGRRLTSTQYEYNFFGVKVSLRISSCFADGAESLQISTEEKPYTWTSVFINISIPLTKRGLVLQYETPSIPYSSENFISLRPYYVHEKGTPFYEAALALDVEKAKLMIEQGKASPFDQIEGVCDSLILCRDLLSQNQISRHIQWSKFMLGYSSLGGRYINGFSTIINLAFTSGIQRKGLYDLLDLVSKYSENDPFEGADGLDLLSLSLLDESLHQDPLLQIIDRNFCIDWNCREFSYSDEYFENSRLMFQDPEGYGLEIALSKGKWYNLLSDIRIIQRRPQRIFICFQPMAMLLNFIHDYQGHRSEQEVIDCCTKRLKIILKNGMSIQSCLYTVIRSFEDSAIPLNSKHYSVVDYALKTGTWGPLSKMLLNLEWIERDLQNIYDEEILCGISALMEGLEYNTMEFAREQFLDRLQKGSFGGEFGDLNEDTLHELAVHLSIPVFRVDDAISEAIHQHSIMKDLPGSWPDEYETELVAGKDFLIPWCEGIIDFGEASRPERVYICIHHGHYHTKCQIPRSKWKLLYHSFQLVEMVDDMEKDEDSD